MEKTLRKEKKTLEDECQVIATKSLRRESGYVGMPKRPDSVAVSAVLLFI